MRCRTEMVQSVQKPCAKMLPLKRAKWNGRSRKGLRPLSHARGMRRPAIQLRPNLSNSTRLTQFRSQFCARVAVDLIVQVGEVERWSRLHVHPVRGGQIAILL